MPLRKLALGTVAAVLFVGLSGAGFVRNQRKAAFEAQARREILKYYSSPLSSEESVNTPARKLTSHYSDFPQEHLAPGAIEQFSLQGNGVIVVAKYHTLLRVFRDSNIYDNSDTYDKVNFVFTVRDRWEMKKGHWVALWSHNLRTDYCWKGVGRGTAQIPSQTVQ